MMVAPAATPRPIVDKLNAELSAILAQPDVKEQILKYGLLVTGTTQRVLDFSITGGTVGVTLTRGVELTSGGTATSKRVLPQYRTLSFNGLDVNPASASVSFAESAYPSRVTLFGTLPIVVNKKLITPAVAIVSLAPDELG